jgi:predicted metal-dependent hydrolase
LNIMSLIDRFRGARAAGARPVAGLADFVLTLDGVVLPVEVRRHTAARRLKLRYDGLRGVLRLTVPPRANMARARDWVADQRDWVRTQIALLPGGHVVSSGTVLPFGDDLLHIDWRAAAPRAPSLAEGVLTLGGPEPLVGGRVGRWLIAQARAEFTATTLALANGAQLDCTGVSVGDPRARWGSCSASGRIRYSWRLLLAPTFVQRSVVAHEVAHLAHMHHGPAFHRLAENLLGEDPARARAWLHAKGGALHHWQFGKGETSMG